MARASDNVIAEVPASCTCTWVWTSEDGHWHRIGPKEDCPWHTYEQAEPRRRHDPIEFLPEWLDQDVAWRKTTRGEA